MWLDEGLLEFEVDVDWHEREKVLKAPSTSTCTPTTRRTRPSSGTSSGRPTRTPPGTRRGSRCARTGGCTWATAGTASGWPTTRRTATTSPGTRATAAARTPACGSACCARRSSPTRRPTRAGTCCATRWCPAPSVADAAEAGYALNLPLRSRTGSRGRAAGPRRRAGVRRGGQARRGRLGRRGRAAVRAARRPDVESRVRATFEHSSVTEVDILERRRDSGAWDGETLRLRPFQIVTLRFRRRRSLSEPSPLVDARLTRHSGWSSR